MRILRGMQRSICTHNPGWTRSFSRGIGVNVPKVRTRDKPTIHSCFLISRLAVMTRILVQRGSSATGSSSNQSRTSSNSPIQPPIASASSCSSSSSSSAPDVAVVPDEGLVLEQVRDEGFDQTKDVGNETADDFKTGTNENQLDSINNSQSLGLCLDNLQTGSASSQPPPPPLPPPKPSGIKRFVSANSDSPRIGPSRRPAAWPPTPRTSASASRPSSPRSHCESEGYNSADEQTPSFGSSYYDLERERQFEIDIRRAKGLEVKRMLEDGNCLFRAVADQVYGDSEAFDLTRQMSIDYMERERDHFSQFITEGFASYCKRKRRDKVYGNNVEIQALSEMYNRPIHIYSCSTEPINIFHGNYDTDLPPIRLSYHHGNHYNSLVDPRRLSVGAGLGFSSLRGRNVDKDQVKSAMKAQQEQQIDNALLAEGRFYSDLELTEKEIERMVMEASRAEYLSGNTSKQHVTRGSSASSAEPSSSGARASDSENEKESGLPDVTLSSSMQVVLSMGFGYLQVIEAYSIFGDDVDSMVCYLLETSNRRKGKATE